MADGMVALAHPLQWDDLMVRILYWGSEACLLPSRQRTWIRSLPVEDDARRLQAIIGKEADKRENRNLHY